MKLNFAIICDNAFTDSEGRLTVIQTFDELRTDNFPVIHPRMTIVTKFVLGNDDSRDKEYSQTLKIVEKTSGDLLIEGNPGRVTPKSSGTKSIQFISHFVGLKLDRPGDYEVQISVDSKSLGTAEFLVRNE